MPILDLLQDITQSDEEAETWGAAALASRHEEAAPYIKTMLKEGTPQEQYLLARTLKDSQPERYQETLLQLATTPNAHTQARIGALYALSRVSLDQHSQRTLAAMARNTKSPLLRRTILIALQHSSRSSVKNTLEAFLHHEDPLTRIYAARLLLETHYNLPADDFLKLAKHKDYLIRQEAYMVLGEYTDSAITNFLDAAATTETNQSAARAARLALKMQKLNSRQKSENQEETLSLLLDAKDDRECWLGIQLAMRHDKSLGTNALKRLASSESVLQEPAAAQLTAEHSPKNTAVNTKQLPEYKHALTIHESLAQYNVALHNNQLLTPTITPEMEQIFVQGTLDADIGIKPLTHAWDPLTDRGFLRRHGFGGSAREYAAKLLQNLDGLCAYDTLAAEEQIQAWHLAGNIFHLLQDMTSPLHVFCVWHAFHGHYETYWKPFSDEALTAVDTWNMQPLTLPSIPQAAVFRLDNHSRSALERRLSSLSDSLDAYQEALAWCTYYRASFWGEIRYAEQASATNTLAATFDADVIDAMPNILDRMFDHNIRYHTSWLNDYFEITDRSGNTFTWNRMFALDDWRPCANPQGQQLVDGHVFVSDDIPRITGRFYFTHKWKQTPYCFPFAYPDGTIMSDHIVQYYGKSLFPVTVAYCGGWLLALAEQYPAMFSPAALSKNESANSTLSENFIDALREILSGSNGTQQNLTESPATPEEYLQLYLPRCGCNTN